MVETQTQCCVGTNIWRTIGANSTNFDLDEKVFNFHNNLIAGMSQLVRLHCFGRGEWGTALCW